MEKSPTYLSIIIPAYNEEARILPTLEKVEAFKMSQPYATEVIVVDDCSTDRTSSVIRTFISGKSGYTVITHRVNTGKGGAIRDGMVAATGKFRLFSDADLSVPIEEVNSLLKYIKGSNSGYDIVIGSRRVNGARIEIRQPFFREFAGRIFSVLVRVVTLPRFLDTQCGFKLFTAEAGLKVFPLQTIQGFGFDVELLFIARKVFNFRILEAPVRWSDSPATKVRLLKDSLNMFADLLRIRLNSLKGKYT